MKISKKQKMMIAHLIQKNFDEAFAKLPKNIQDAIHARPTFLGSEKFFDITTNQIVKDLENENRK